MWINILWFAVGLVMLIKGGDWFVDGASGIARRFHLPELLIGATVVSIGTTLPEVMVSAGGAMAGSGGMAYGNAVGSIICNTSLIAAVTVAIKPGKADRRALILPVSFFFGAAAFYMSVAYFFGEFSRIVGIALLCTFAIYITLTLVQMKKGMSRTCDIEEHVEAQAESEVENSGKKGMGMIKDIVFLVIGAAIIAVGADLLVDNGTKIAEILGVPDTVIALTFVALGTSLPEFVTAITSLIKGHGALSLGNIIGANLFNLVFVSGVATVISPFPVPSESTINGMPASLVLDLPVMLGVMLLLIVPTLIRGKLSRVQGIILLSIYAAFCTLQFII
ncbi:MAG: calcium/sodium antiporter [Clostridia bacterium]|nr:calcium/sodium antiporter [Clostridia bacterium]